MACCRRSTSPGSSPRRTASARPSTSVPTAARSSPRRTRPSTRSGVPANGWADDRSSPLVRTSTDGHPRQRRLGWHWSDDETGERGARMGQFFQQFANGIAQGSVYALIGMGVTLVFGLTRLINFAHGEFLAIGAMTLWGLSGDGWGFWVNMP